MPDSPDVPNPYDDPAFRRDMVDRMAFIRSYTHAVLRSNGGVGTGVSFRVGNRLFLITAGHLLIDRPRFDVALFVGHDRPAIFGRVLNYHFHSDSNSGRDIGFIELEDVPAVSACSLEQFAIGPPVPNILARETFYFIAGYPESGVRQTELGLAIIPGRLLDGDAATLRLEYDRSGYDVREDTYTPIDFFSSPRGFSGGGLWAMMARGDGELFIPHRHVRPVGTQYQWNPDTRVMTGQRTRISLAFFFDHYPELRTGNEQIIQALQT